MPYPLVLTAFEVRYPSTPRLRSVLTSLAEAMSHRLPDISRDKEGALGRTSLGFGAHRGLTEPALMTMANPERTEVCTVRDNVVALEVTQYASYEDFRALIGDFLHALYRTEAIISIDRVGIRYLDELRTGTVEGASDWAEWIRPELVSPLNLATDYTVLNYTGTLRFQLDHDCFLSLRWGALRRPALRQSMSTGLRIRRPNGSAPVFMLDLDGAWVPDSATKFDDIEKVLSATDRLHSAIKQLFASSVQEQLLEQIASGGSAIQGEEGVAR
ncbi:TIGR04255 family protein [Micromonospora sp. S-DT3-3-22]|uniref:TIGR04255 family protein n=1 Tax=Micromonospora sp. S-DT3-3-22 TaxID=2755359 RepID=UPI001E5B41DE|nr:TIGR04255 family protein [Micromonospora sp. S-DT3-3-22]